MPTACGNRGMIIMGRVAGDGEDVRTHRFQLARHRDENRRRVFAAALENRLDAGRNFRVVVCYYMQVIAIVMRGDRGDQPAHELDRRLRTHPADHADGFFRSAHANVSR